MKKVALAVLLGVIGAAAACSASAETASNFKLPDQHGVTHELHGLSHAKAVVIMVQGNGCPIVRNAWPAFREVREAFWGRGVEFLMLNPNLQDDRLSILREAEAFRIDMPILIDETQSAGESLRLIRTAEILVIDPKTWEIVYRGPLDDRLTYEYQKPVSQHYLRDVLDAMLSGKSIAVARRESLGCLINFPRSVAAR